MRNTSESRLLHLTRSISKRKTWKYPHLGRERRRIIWDLQVTKFREKCRPCSPTIAWSLSVISFVRNTPVKILKIRDNKIKSIPTLRARKRKIIIPIRRPINFLAADTPIIISSWWAVPTTLQLISNKAEDGTLMHLKLKRILSNLRKGSLRISSGRWNLPRLSKI